MYIFILFIYTCFLATCRCRTSWSRPGLIVEVLEIWFWSWTSLKGLLCLSSVCGERKPGVFSATAWRLSWWAPSTCRRNLQTTCRATRATAMVSLKSVINHLEEVSQVDGKWLCCSFASPHQVAAPLWVSISYSLSGVSGALVVSGVSGVVIVSGVSGVTCWLDSLIFVFLSSRWDIHCRRSRRNNRLRSVSRPAVCHHGKLQRKKRLNVSELQEEKLKPEVYGSIRHDLPTEAVTEC